MVAPVSAIIDLYSVPGGAGGNRLMRDAAAPLKIDRAVLEISLTAAGAVAETTAAVPKIAGCAGAMPMIDVAIARARMEGAKDFGDLTAR